VQVQIIRRLQSENQARLSAHTEHNFDFESLLGSLMQINVQRTWDYIFDNKLGKFRTF